MDAHFLESWFNTRHRVLGRALHPFCLNDALILSLAGSPFLAAEQEEVRYTLPDLQLAVRVCSSPARVFLEARFNERWWDRALTRLVAFWDRRQSLEAQCQAFVAYLDDFYAPPALWRDEDGDEVLRAPWVLANAVFLMRHTTYRPEEIWALPIGQALWIAATLAEQNGSSAQIVSEEEAAAMTELGL
ncbi:hypothetical protein BH20VER3_BH20VER3_01010 [soil metagenome]